VDHSRAIKEKNKDAPHRRTIKDSLKPNLAVSIRSRLEGFHRVDLDLPTREQLPERLEDFGDMVMRWPHKFSVDTGFGPDVASTKKDTDRK